MIFSLAVIIIGVTALVIGELKITPKRKITSTVVRTLAAVLIIGSIIGVFTSVTVTLITVFLVLIIALLLMEETTDIKPVQIKKEAGDITPDSLNISSPTTPVQQNHSLDPTIDHWFSPQENTNSFMPPPAAQQETYEPIQKYYPYMDFADTINAPITGTTFISAATRVDTYPVHSDFLVYDIKAAYARKPGQPILCPKCGGLLKASPIQPSLGVRKDLHKIDLAENHRFSYLFNCGNCKWWCIRENWKSLEKPNTIFDFLVAGGIPANRTMSIKYNEVAYSQNPEPWAKALIFRDIYEYSERLPENLKLIFPRT